MPDNQVIRIKQVDHDASLGTTVTFFDDNDQRWAIVGDVIELTEERGVDRASFIGIEYEQRRLVSEWTDIG